MKRHSILFPLLGILLISFHVDSQAQIGFRASYQSMQSLSWEETVAEMQGQNQARPLWDNGVHYELDYWFRLRNVRVEFFPALGFSRHQMINNAFGLADEDFQLQVYRFAFHTQLYPFDFFGDCDCPTFSKQNPFFKKGFFLSVSPALSLLNPRLSDDLADSRIWTPGITIGAGIDIGFSDFITLTPFAQYGYDLNASWEGISDFIPEENRTSDSSELDTAAPVMLERWQIGARLGFRWRT
jgi:hypothetical protein